MSSEAASPAVENLVIVGSGPAGYTAAIYAARAQLSPLVFEGAVDGLHDDEPWFEADLEPWDEALTLLRGLGGESPQPGRVRLPAGVDPAVLVEALVRGGVRVRALAPRRRSLEDFYMGLLGATAVAPD